MSVRIEAGDMRELPNAGKYGCILADPPWRFEAFSGPKLPTTAVDAYATMRAEDLAALPVAGLAAPDSVLVLWVTWPTLEHALNVMRAWGFDYKTCAFCWVKANARQIELFREDISPHMTMGYWTRSNSEVALLGTRGKPKRLAADVRQAIIEPGREHSRKPDSIHGRIERLVAGPYLELFARQRRLGWDAWGNEVDKFAPATVATA